MSKERLTNKEEISPYYDRFLQSWQYLKRNNIVKRKVDLAKKMGASTTNVSSVLSGNTRFLTRNFLLRYNDAFGDMFNTRWLLYGEGYMLRQGNTASAENSHNSIVNAGNHVSIIGNTTNQYGDSPNDSRNWTPVEFVQFVLFCLIFVHDIYDS